MKGATRALEKEKCIYQRQIQQWPIDRLIPYARNARTHSAEQVAQVAASIREFGFTNPILIDSDSGVIAGHARLEAARKLSLTEVPVIVLDHLTETQKRAYILVDNRLALNAGWDDELLAAELATLREEEFDLNLLGFDDEEMDRLRNELDSPLDADENAAPEVEEIAVSRPGDLWLLGPHRVLCGDACSRADLDRVLDGQPADMVFTDPPYNVDYAPEDAQGRERRIANDNLGEDFPEFLRQVCTHLVACEQRRDLYRDVVFGTPHPEAGLLRSGRALVDVSDLGQGPVHAGILRLPAAV